VPSDADAPPAAVEAPPADRVFPALLEAIRLEAARVAPDPPKERCCPAPVDATIDPAPAAAAEPELDAVAVAPGALLPPALPPPSAGNAVTLNESIPAKLNPLRFRPERLPRICGAISETNFSAAVTPDKRSVRSIAPVCTVAVRKPSRASPASRSAASCCLKSQ